MSDRELVDATLRQLRLLVPILAAILILAVVLASVGSVVTVNTLNRVEDNSATIEDIQRLRAARVRDFARADRQLCHALTPTSAFYRIVLALPPNPQSRATPAQIAAARRELARGIKAVDALHCERLSAPSP